MKIVKLVSGVVLTLSVVWIVGSYSKNLAQTASLEEKTKLSSPEIALNEFWKAAYQGNEKRLVEASLFSKVNVFDICPEEEPPSPIELVSYKDEKQVSYSKYTIFPYSSDDLTDSIKIFVRYIYVNKISWNRFRVVGERFYKDEALLTVKIADYGNDFSKGEEYALAFKKEGSEWKLIDSIQLGIIERTYENIEYASPQPCK